NKKRQEQVSAQVGSELYEDDMSNYLLNDEDMSFDEDMDLGTNIDDVGEKTTTAVSNVLARTAEYQVEATRQSTNRILAQTAAMSATLHSDLSVLNANVGGLMKFNSDVMTTH